MNNELRIQNTENSHINIVIGFDTIYLQHVVVMLTSLLKNNTASSITIYAITSHDFSELKFINTLSKRYNVNIVFIFLTEALLQGANVHGHVSIATYYRLLLGDLLPKSCTRIIYLDCDIIVNGSLIPLWECDLENSVIAAVREPNITLKHLGEYDNVNYFNAGVMVINLNKWREKGIERKLNSFMKTNSEKLILWDQDVLNGVLNKCWIELPNKWNFKQENKINDIMPVIIHYAGSMKPWNFYSEMNQLNKYYFTYLKKTKFYKLYLVKKVKFNIVNSMKLVLYIMFFKFRSTSPKDKSSLLSD